MICPSCQVQNIPGAKYCDNCGLTMPPPGSAPETDQTPGVVPPPTTSLKAVFSLVSGLLFFVPFSSIVAIVLGHWSRGEIKRSAGRLKGSGFARAGLIIGYGIIAVIVVFIGVIVGGNVGNIRGHFKSGADVARVGASMSFIRAAQESYTKTYPELGYSCQLSELGGSGGSKEHAGLIDDQLASGKKYGYTFELLNCEDHKHFAILAAPTSHEDPTNPTFCMDEAGTLFNSFKSLPKVCRKKEKDAQ